MYDQGEDDPMPGFIKPAFLLLAMPDTPAGGPSPPGQRPRIGRGRSPMPAVEPDSTGRAPA
jgi:hypothetical protein